MFNNLSYSFDQLILSSSSFSISYLPICQLLFPVHSYFGELLLSVFRFGDLLLFFSSNFIYMTLFSICSTIFPNSVSSTILPLFSALTFSSGAGLFSFALPFANFSLSSSLSFSSMLLSNSMRLILSSFASFSYPLSYLHSLSPSSHHNFYMTLFSSYLVLPLYSTISFYVLSFDVIHSFGYHSFGFKSDAILGRVNSVAALSLFVPGFYSSYCYELCGSSYTSMLSAVIVLS